HHQAVEYLSPLLRKSALSEDGLIEAFEWNELHGRGFLLGVQWHPERMDYTNPFSLPIAQHFLYEAESYQLLVQGVKKIIDSE
ncbi:MAG: gamma-glutamyl-gamma-aminobutyrate hydrolase family protein, partial [Candidatus Kapabacteria bacterium]|nr:gamma-glutamyl-gamma-aminobutyrate hydrolase family protein [Candidatus Kapabacteria bacterium]